MTDAALERASFSYRKGYRDAEAMLPFSIPNSEGIDGDSSVLRPFSATDYMNGYEAGRNDFYWHRRRALRW